MKIALINENSQAAKNGIIEAALKKVVEPMGHEVVNYGMYAADDAAQLPRRHLRPCGGPRGRLYLRPRQRRQRRGHAFRQGLRLGR